MACRFVFLMSLLTIVWADIAIGEWDYLRAEETRLLADGNLEEGTDENGIRYVIAVGTEEKPETIQAERIEDALSTGKEIRLKWVEIKESIVFEGEIKPAAFFRSAIFSGYVSFGSATFSRADFSNAAFSRADFGSAKFSRADFGSAKFSGKADFSNAAFSRNTDFSNATFSGDADFGSAKFSGDADFSDAKFSGYVSFRYATFSGEADFGSAKFNRADFLGATFSGKADFRYVTFSGKADFGYATFSGKADFGYATFSGKADFGYAIFKERTNFSNCRFKDLSHFVGCLYPANTKMMNFSSVTGFSQMQFEWEYNPQWDDEWKTVYGETINNSDRKIRGLRGHLEYDKTFYIALIKNYQDMGWLDEADDCYYTYRVEKRKQVNEYNEPLHSWHKRVVEYIVLDFPFGYGVKPFKLFRSVLLLWIPFGWYYVFFLCHREKGTSPWSTAPFTRHEFWGFVWGFLHSLNVLTPGIDFHSLSDPFLRKSSYRFCGESEVIINAQRLQQVFGWYLLALFFILFGKIWIR